MTSRSFKGSLLIHVYRSIHHGHVVTHKHIIKMYEMWQELVSGSHPHSLPLVMNWETKGNCIFNSAKQFAGQTYATMQNFYKTKSSTCLGMSRPWLYFNLPKACIWRVFYKKKLSISRIFILCKHGDKQQHNLFL